VQELAEIWRFNFNILLAINFQVDKDNIDRFVLEDNVGLTGGRTVIENFPRHNYSLLC